MTSPRREPNGFEFLLWIPVLLSGLIPLLGVTLLGLPPLGLLPFLVVACPLGNYVAYRAVRSATGIDLLAKQKGPGGGHSDEER